MIVYDTSKIIINNIDRKFNKFKRYSMRPCCFVCVERLKLKLKFFLTSLSIEEGRFSEVASTIFIQKLFKTSDVSFGSFLRTPFSSIVMVSLPMIPLLVKTGLIVFQNDLLPFCCYFSKIRFFQHIRSCCCLRFFSFIFIGQKVTPEDYLKYTFLDISFFLINAAWLP